MFVIEESSLFLSNLYVFVDYSLMIWYYIYYLIATYGVLF